MRHYRVEWATKGIVVAAFRPGLDEIITVSGAKEEEVFYIINWLDELLNDYAMNILNGFNVDIEGASVTYVDENWVFIGAQVEAD